MKNRIGQEMMRLERFTIRGLIGKNATVRASRQWKNRFHKSMRIANKAMIQEQI